VDRNSDHDAENADVTDERKPQQLPGKAIVPTTLPAAVEDSELCVAVSTTGPLEGGPAVSINADFCGWLYDQASALRRLRPSALDWQNLAEELEAMARKDRTSLRSHLQNLLCHLLKWAYQPSHRSSSWKRTIDTSRDSIEDYGAISPNIGVFSPGRWSTQGYTLPVSAVLLQLNSQRLEACTLLDESPSLRNVIGEVFLEPKTYSRAVRDAFRDTASLPYATQPPWTLDQVFDPNFLPD
jgi:hypothetical protein